MDYVDVEFMFEEDGSMQATIICHGGKATCITGDDAKLLRDLVTGQTEGFDGTMAEDGTLEEIPHELPVSTDGEKQMAITQKPQTAKKQGDKKKEEKKVWGQGFGT